jgi:hypothetical protein
MPIKLNRSYWTSALTRLLPSAEDPRVLFERGIDQQTFTNAISAFKFKTTQKTTEKDRFPLTIRVMKELNLKDIENVLDVGASDGITSVDVMEALSPKKYYVTDLNVYAFYRILGDRVYFFDEDGKCVLIVTDRLVVYADHEGAIFPFNVLAAAYFESQPSATQPMASIELINPSLQDRSNEIVIQKYDIFSPWPHEKVAMVLAANILNRVYFSDGKLLAAIRNLVRALNQMGRLVIIDNRQVESATVFQLRADKLVVERQVNGGTEIEALIRNNQTYLIADM